MFHSPDRRNAMLLQPRANRLHGRLIELRRALSLTLILPAKRGSRKTVRILGAKLDCSAAGFVRKMGSSPSKAPKRVKHAKLRTDNAVTSSGRDGALTFIHPALRHQSQLLSETA
jgi:hypothetical protein